MTEAAHSDLRRYGRLIKAMLPADFPFTATAETGGRVQVERGTVFPLCLRGRPFGGAATERVGPLIEAGGGGAAASGAVIDCLGHSRPPYRGLLVYCWAQAYALAREALGSERAAGWERGLRAWCQSLEPSVGPVQLSASPAGARGGGIAASDGARVTGGAWAALALHAAGEFLGNGTWSDLAIEVFGGLVRRQHGSGAFFAAGNSDNPETRWYHELVLLHALGSFAARAADPAALAAAGLAAEYHLRETQPDHATTQPWAVFAFLLGPASRPLADEVLHAAGLRPSGLSFMLLADAVHCLRRLTGQR